MQEIVKIIKDHIILRKHTARAMNRIDILKSADNAKTEINFFKCFLTNQICTDNCFIKDWDFAIYKANINILPQ